MFKITWRNPVKNKSSVTLIFLSKQNKPTLTQTNWVPDGFLNTQNQRLSPIHTGVAIASDDAFSTILTRKRDNQFNWTIFRDSDGFAMTRWRIN